MRSIVLIIALLGLVGCGTQVEATFITISRPEATARPQGTAPAARAGPPSSTADSVTVTFRLTLTGTVPDDAVFALQSGTDRAGGGAYLCAYYGGHPVCTAGETYEDAYAFAPGTRVAYRLWRELDVNGTSEEIQAGEITVGAVDEVISVSYDFHP